jgi:hypothetical protein
MGTGAPALTQATIRIMCQSPNDAGARECLCTVVMVLKQSMTWPSIVSVRMPTDNSTEALSPAFLAKHRSRHCEGFWKISQLAPTAS